MTGDRQRQRQSIELVHMCAAALKGSIQPSAAALRHHMCLRSSHLPLAINNYRFLYIRQNVNFSAIQSQIQIFQRCVNVHVCRQIVWTPCQSIIQWDNDWRRQRGAGAFTCPECCDWLADSEKDSAQSAAVHTAAMFDGVNWKLYYWQPIEIGTS